MNELNYSASQSTLEVKMDSVVAMLERIEAKVVRIEDRQRVAELASARLEAETAILNAKADRAHQRLDKHDELLSGLPAGEELQAFCERVRRLEPPVKLFTWLGTGLGISLLALLWAIFTHQVRLVFP
jgi:hypothetical protein